MIQISERSFIRSKHILMLIIFANNNLEAYFLFHKFMLFVSVREIYKSEFIFSYLLYRNIKNFLFYLFFKFIYLFFSLLSSYILINEIFMKFLNHLSTFMGNCI